jgi:lipopolysaccharide export system permease protein
VKILDRYILKELVGPFVFGVAAFTLIFVAADLLLNLAELMAQHGLGFLDAAKLFLYSLPQYAVWTFPMAMLLATLMALGRLSSESEMVAMWAGGVSFSRLVVPVVAAGLAVSLVSIWFTDSITPRAFVASQRILRESGGLTTGKEGVVLFGYTAGRVSSILYAEKLSVAAGRMQGVTLINLRDAQPRIVVSARTARWKGKRWWFYDGRMVVLLPRARPTVEFGSEGMEMDVSATPQQIAQGETNPQEMSLAQLESLIQHLRARGAPVADLVIAWQHKLSIPFACLVFAVLAAPLSVRSHRSSHAWGFGISLAIIFAYYVLWHYLTVLAKSAVLNPVVAAWAPNVVGLAVGAVLIFRRARH